MQPITPIVTDHQLILEGLEVLRLIAGHIEMDEFVEPEDITTVLDFLRDVGCENLVSDLIFEEGQFLLHAAVDLLDDPAGRLHVGEFAEQERRIRAIAVGVSPTLHRLESKYAYPHCI